MVPKKCDAPFVHWAGKSYLADIASVGVKVLYYTGGFLHSKIWVIDDSLASCGSTNVDFRSFENNFEANIFFYDHDVALRFKAVFEEDEKLCYAYDVSNGKCRKFGVKLFESLTRLLSPLF